LDELDLRSRNAIHRRIESKQLQLQSIAAALQALSPLGVLQRGYSLSYRLPRSAAEEQTPRLIRKADELQLGDRIETRFVTGRVISNVESIDANIAPYEPKKSQDDS
jgi:exodeoxyribonuclease VII large subunit